MNSELIPLAVFPHISIAQISRSYLEASGILCFIFDEHLNSYGMGYGPHFSGIRLMVRKADYEEALLLLKQAPDIDLPEEGAGSSET